MESILFDKVFSHEPQAHSVHDRRLGASQKAFLALVTLIAATGAMIYWRQGNPVLVVAVGLLWGVVGGAILAKLFPTAAHGLIAGLLTGTNAPGSDFNVPQASSWLAGQLVAVSQASPDTLAALIPDITLFLSTGLVTLVVMLLLSLFFESESRP